MRKSPLIFNSTAHERAAGRHARILTTMNKKSSSFLITCPPCVRSVVSVESSLNKEAHPRVSPRGWASEPQRASESRRRQAPVIVLRLSDSLNTCLRFLEVQKVHLLTSRTFHFHMPRAGHPPFQKQPPTSDAPHLFERETSVERHRL